MSSLLRYCGLTVLGLAAVGVLNQDTAVGQQRTKAAQQGPKAAPAAASRLDPQVRANVERMLAEGMQTFRYDTFGSEDFWGGQLKLHRAIEGEKFGGVGAGVSPKQALDLGLKVDMEKVPQNVATAINERAAKSAKTGNKAAKSVRKS